MTCTCGPCPHCIMKKIREEEYQKKYPEEYE